jgi:hypothetical protein
MVGGFFNNTLIDNTDPKTMTFFEKIHYYLTCINYYYKNVLDKTMIELNEDDSKKYRFPKNLKCDAQFKDTHLVKNAYKYKAWSLDNALKEIFG